MKHNKTITFLLLGLASLSMSISAMAAGNVELKHTVTSNQTDSVSFSFTIDNFTTQDLISATLIPSDSEFTSANTNNAISIGDLFANSQVNIDWTATTTMSGSYYESGIPLYFILKANNSIGENIEFFVHSSGVTQ